MGSSVGGSNSVFERSLVADPSPGGESTRSSRPSGGRGGGQVGAGGRGVATRPANATSGLRVPRRSQDSMGSSTLRVTPSNSPSSPAYTRSPPSQRPTPSQPSAYPRQPRRSSGASSGPGGYLSR